VPYTAFDSDHDGEAWKSRGDQWWLVTFGRFSGAEARVGLVETGGHW